MPGRESHVDRLAHIGLVRGEKQGHAQRPHETVGRTPLHEDRARDVQTVALNGTHDAHSSLRIITREDHDLHQALFLRQVVEPQEPANKRESDAGCEHVIEMLALILPILFFTLLAEHRVRLPQVEQSTRRDPNDEGTLQIQFRSHDAPSTRSQLSSPG